MTRNNQVNVRQKPQNPKEIGTSDNITGTRQKETEESVSIFEGLALVSIRPFWTPETPMGVKKKVEKISNDGDQ